MSELPDPIEIGISRQYHSNPAEAMRADMRSRLKRSPDVKFADLKAGWYYAVMYHDCPKEIWRVVAMSPAGRKLRYLSITNREGEPSEYSTYAGDHEHQSFRQIGIEDVAVAFVTHFDVVAGAKDQQFEIPADVRCEHPQLFITIPGGVTAEWVKDQLTKVNGFRTLGGKVVGPDTIGARIHCLGKELAALTARRAALAGMGDDAFQVAQEESAVELERLAWLLPMVGKGGPFHQPGKVQFVPSVERYNALDCRPKLFGAGVES